MELSNVLKEESSSQSGISKPSDETKKNVYHSLEDVEQLDNG